MANKTPVKAIFSGSDVTSLGEFASGDTIDVSFIADGTITAAKLAADTATQAELDTVSGVASAALPKAGGAMTGAITTNSTFDGVDIATRDAILTSTTTTAAAALPKAGGTMTGHLYLGDSNLLRLGASNDLTIYHNHTASRSYITDTIGYLELNSQIISLKNQAENETMLHAVADGAVNIYHNNVKKFETTANGVTVSGTAIATTDTDTSNSGSVTLDFAANQNFVLTLTGNVTLANPSTEQVGQSGFIAFIQDGTGSRTVSLGTDYETAAAAGLTLTATASATDLVPYLVVAANRILLGTPQLAFA